MRMRMRCGRARARARLRTRETSWGNPVGSPARESTALPKVAFQTGEKPQTALKDSGPIAPLIVEMISISIIT